MWTRAAGMINAVLEHANLQAVFPALPPSWAEPAGVRGAGSSFMELFDEKTTFFVINSEPLWVPAA